MKRVILHIDMDAFYASVEQLKNPALIGKPVIVGGTSNRGVVSTASYEARKFGVHSAMPIFQARQKCPQGIFLPVRMALYLEYSDRIMDILTGFSPVIEPVSIDEAYMDLSGLEKLFGSPRQTAIKIKAAIKQELNLSCSIGIAPNKFLSKIASEIQKPNGLTLIKEDDVSGFIKKLPIKKVTGVGEKALQILESLGVHFLGQVQRVPEPVLNRHLGKFSHRLIELSQGMDDIPVISHMEPKSIGSEETLPQDTNNKEVLKEQIFLQAEIVGKKLRKQGMKGKTITLKLKKSDFKLMTRSLTLGEPTDSAQCIYEQAKNLFDGAYQPVKFRLVGVTMSNLAYTTSLPRQMNLFEKKYPNEKVWDKIEKAMDFIEDKFGQGTIRRGRFIKTKTR